MAKLLFISTFLLLSSLCNCSNESDISSFLLLNSDIDDIRHHRFLKESSDSHGCTINECLGVKVFNDIKKDFKPWIDKGGITARDIDAAERKLQKVEGYIRVSILEGHFFPSSFQHTHTQTQPKF